METDSYWETHWLSYPGHGSAWYARRGKGGDIYRFRDGLAVPFTWSDGEIVTDPELQALVGMDLAALGEATPASNFVIGLQVVASRMQEDLPIVAGYLLSDYVDITVAFTGWDPTTGEQVDTLDRVVAGASVIFGSYLVWRELRKGRRAADCYHATGGHRAINAGLDATGKVHGRLPDVEDLQLYDVDELARLRDELTQSVQQRIEIIVEMGSDFGHSERLATEQQLIKSIEKHLKNR